VNSTKSTPAKAPTQRARQFTPLEYG
jgi:hypothetical protein